MKRSLVILTSHLVFTLLFFQPALFAQSSEDSIVEYPVPKFALSVNPLGFVQFGPVLSAEFGLGESALINAHLRFSSLGVLSWWIRDDPDEMSAFAYGAGVERFLGTNRNRPYIGFFMERETSESTYALDYIDEWTQNNKTTVIIFNIGYRFNFNDGFFINTGAFLGGAVTKYDWEYRSPSLINDNSARSGNESNAFGMLEVSFGLAF